MTTRDELHRIANTPGFGAGQAFRDRKAAENAALETLPDAGTVPIVEARGDDGSHLVLMARFGNSNEDDRDWALFHAASEATDFWCFGGDARTDAQTVAAIINAYAMGLLVSKD